MLTYLSKIGVLVLAASLSLSAQDASKSCQTDLLALDGYVRKLPSFKQQIKGDKLTAYERNFETLKQRTAQPLTDFECFCQITRLLDPIKDNHLGLYQTNGSIDRQKALDVSYMKQVRETAFFKTHPKVNVDLTALEERLSNKPIDDVEGIYSQWNAINVGIFRSSRPDSLIGVVLSSRLPQWDRGDLMMLLREKAPNRFRSLIAYPNTKVFMLQMNDKFVSGMLTESRFRKVNKPKDFEHLPEETPVYDLKTLSVEVQYLRLGSFNAMDEFLPVAQRFYDSIKDSLTAPNLIVDLRNNGGGAFKNSRKFLKLIEQYSKRGRVYTLVNGRTVSNAEQFTLRLRKLKNHTLLGTRTCGMLTYGSNYGQRYELPSNRYKFAITDMKGDPDKLRYEDEGIEPDVYLKLDEDFVGQVVAHIGKAETTSGPAKR